MGRMTNRDRREQAFDRVLGQVGGYIAPADGREVAAVAPEWIIMAANMDGRREYLRSRNGRGYNEWTADPRAASSGYCFDSEDEAGMFITRTFSEWEINTFRIVPAAFSGGGHNGR